MKKLTAICAIILLAMAGYFGWRYIGGESEGLPGTPDFIEEGVLTPGWKLDYGATQAASLSFTEDALCIREDVGSGCDVSQFKVGDRVSVVGVRSEESIEVIALTFLTPDL